ncbi:MAG: hypothetical protein DRJ30_01600 [Candidatus Methanomethylicota archaeon]|nr:MAG: hypothetical protein DRJ30_01600 [Candidatus Verstraetearchaeota archaeon]
MSRAETKKYPLRKEVKGLPRQFKSPLKNIFMLGHVPRLSGFLQRTRAKLGLEKKPPTAYSNEKALNELRKIISDLELDSRVLWDWKRKRFKY